MMQQHVALVEHARTGRVCASRERRRPAAAADRAAPRTPAARRAPSARADRPGPGIGTRRRMTSSWSRSSVDQLGGAPRRRLPAGRRRCAAGAAVRVRRAPGACGRPRRPARFPRRARAGSRELRGLAARERAAAGGREMMSSSSTNADGAGIRDSARAVARPGGTWTIARRRADSPGAASSSSARLRLSDDSSGKGRGDVDRERRQHRQHGSLKKAPSATAALGRAPSTKRSGCRRSANAGRSSSPTRRYSDATNACARSATAASCCAGVSPARSGAVSSSSIALLAAPPPAP